MKANFQFAKPLVWGSIALLMIVIAGCSLPTSPDSGPPPGGEIKETEKTAGTEGTEETGGKEETEETGGTDETEDAEETGETEGTEETEETGEADETEAEETGETEKAEEAEETEETGKTEETGGTEETKETGKTEETNEAEKPEETGKTGEAPGQDSAGESGKTGDENGGQGPGDGQDKPGDKTGEGPGPDSGQDPGGGQNPGEGQPGGEQGNTEGGGNAGSPLPGELTIRIGNINKSEGVYPDLGAISRYLLDFSSEDGRTAESLYLEANGELSVALDAGEWEIGAYGLIERGGKPPLAVIRGTARVTVYENMKKTVSIAPDGLADTAGEQGFLSWDIDYPEAKTWGAVLAASVKIDGNNFIPYKYFDLTAPGAKKKRVSLPPGTYRIESRFMSHNASAGSAEIVHIFPGLETASRHTGTAGNAFPNAAEFSSSGELKEYLEGLPENTAEAPYPVKFNGADLSSKEKTGETLRTLYDALSRYVTLDLRGCTGAELIAASTSPSLGGRKKIVSLILPETIAAVKPNGFSGYEALESAVLPKVSAIDYAAFHDLEKLEEVSAPELIKLDDSTNSASTSKGVFYQCGALKTVYFPKLETIAHHAFYECVSLAEAAFPNLRAVGGLAFKKCAALQAVSLPSVTKIAKSGFEETGALAYLVLGSDPPELETDVFKNGGFLQSGTIYAPPEAAGAYQDTALPNWPGLKGLVKPLPGPAAF